MNYTVSPEVNRRLAQGSEDGLKFFFKWLSIGIKAFAEFAVGAVKSIVGK